MARPEKDIDKDEFEKLCSLQCTREEIAFFFGVTEKTLLAWCKREYGRTFSEVFKGYKAVGRVSLRRAGYELALKNPAVWIFHAKNHLLMKDSPDEVPENNSVRNIAEAIRMLRGEKGTD